MRCLCEQSEKHDFSDAHHGSEQIVNATTTKAQEEDGETIFNSQIPQNKPQVANPLYLNHPLYQGHMYYAQPNIAQNFFQYPNRTPYWNPAYCYPSAQNIPSHSNEVNTAQTPNMCSQTFGCESTSADNNLITDEMCTDKANVNEMAPHPVLVDPSFQKTITNQQYTTSPSFSDNNSNNNEDTFIVQPIHPVMTQSMPWPHPPLGCAFASPILPPTPVCSNCNNFMVPSWKCPSGHSELPQMSMPNPSLFTTPQITQPIASTQCAIPNQLIHPNIATQMIPPHLCVSNGMVPNQSHMMMAQPIWNHSSQYNMQPQSVVSHQAQPEVSFENQIVEPLIYDRPEPLTHTNTLLEVPTQSNAVTSKIQFQPQNANANPLSEPKLSKDSLEPSKQTSEMHPRSNRSIGHSLWNGMYNRRSNGLDPGYDRLARLRNQTSESRANVAVCSVIDCLLKMT